MAWKKKSNDPYPESVPPAPGYSQYPAARIDSPADLAYSQDQESAPPPPVILDSEEQLLDYKKPKFRGYPAAVFGFFFGFVVLVLLSIGADGGGFVLGMILWIIAMLLIRSRFWRRSGYWFTTNRIVIHDGAKVMLIPYDEIALSSVTFEKTSVNFSTIYNKEFSIQGIPNIDELVRFLTKQVELSKQAKGY